MNNLVPLSQAAEINPRGPKPGTLQADEQCDFVPMASVLEDGTMNVLERRPYHQVAKGYTPFRSGDVLLAKITPCFENGKIALAETTSEVAFGSTEFHVIRARQGELDQRYLLYFLRQDALRVDGENKMTGSAGQKRVPRSFLENLEIPLPSIEEQRRIAAILDKADAIRRKREQALDLADEFLKSVFLEMFGDAELNPKQWKTKRIVEILKSEPQNGLYKPSRDYGSGVQILRIDGFYDGYLATNKPLKRLRIDRPTVEKYRLNENDIVINRVNSREYLGKSTVVESLSEETVFESNMMRFSLAETEANARFLVDQLQTSYIKRQILRAAKDAVNQSSINQTDVKNLEVRLPPIELQEKYATIVRQKVSNDSKQIRAQGCAEELFASLSQRAFRGEL